MKKITIRWALGEYKVSEPSWDGGEVYLASDVDQLVRKLELSNETIREALREMECDCHHWQGNGRDQCPRCAALGL